MELALYPVGNVIIFVQCQKEDLTFLCILVISNAFEELLKHFVEIIRRITYIWLSSNAR